MHFSDLMSGNQSQGAACMTYYTFYKLSDIWIVELFCCCCCCCLRDCNFQIYFTLYINVWFFPQTLTNASHRPVRTELRVWMRSTASTAYVHSGALDLDAKSVSCFSELLSKYRLKIKTLCYPALSYEKIFMNWFSMSWFRDYLLCDPVIGIGKTCHYTGLQFPHGSRWEEDCNTCQCINGKVECTKVNITFHHTVLTSPLLFSSCLYRRVLYWLYHHFMGQAMPLGTTVIGEQDTWNAQNKYIELHVYT